MIKMVIFLLKLVSGLHLTLNKQSTELFKNHPDTELAKIFNYYNVFYYINLNIGSPPSRLSVTIDTSSPILWLPDFECETCTHTSKYYDAKNSSSSVDLGEKFSLKYGSNNVTGKAYLDRISCDLNQTAEKVFLLSTTKKYGFKHLPSEGVLGLSIGNRPEKYPSLVEQLYKEGQIKEPFFSLYLSDHLLGVMADTNPPAQLTIGKYDKNLAEDEFRYIRIHHKTGVWASDLQGIQVGNSNLTLSANITVFSTFSPSINGPKADIERLIKSIVKKSYCYLFEGHKICSCKDLASYPVLKFIIDGKVFELGPEFYVVTASGWCLLQLEGDAKLHHYVLGLPFLRKYYTLYSFDKKVMGLATAKQAEVSVNTSQTTWFGLLMILLGVLVLIKKIQSKRSENLEYLQSLVTA